MSDFMLDMALSHFGFSEQQKSIITAAIPKAAYLVHQLKMNRTVINEIIDVAEMIISQINKQEQ